MSSTSHQVFLLRFLTASVYDRTEQVTVNLYTLPRVGGSGLCKGRVCPSVVERQQQ